MNQTDSCSQFLVRQGSKQRLKLVLRVVLGLKEGIYVSLRVTITKTISQSIGRLTEDIPLQQCILQEFVDTS